MDLFSPYCCCHALSQTCLLSFLPSFLSVYLSAFMSWFACLLVLFVLCLVSSFRVCGLSCVSYVMHTTVWDGRGRHVHEGAAQAEETSGKVPLPAAARLRSAARRPPQVPAQREHPRGLRGTSVSVPKRGQHEIVSRKACRAQGFSVWLHAGSRFSAVSIVDL